MKTCPLFFSLVGISALSAAQMACHAEAIISTFGSSADLDLTGNFAYALDIGGDDGPLEVRGVTFTDDEGQMGVSASAENNNAAYMLPDYDQGSDMEDNFEMIMHTIRWDNDALPLNTDVTVTLEVVPGTQYKLQLMFHDNPDPTKQPPRGFDVFLEGTILVDDFASATGSVSQSKLITETFTAGDAFLTIQLDGTNTNFADKNAILSALTLEIVPEPSTLALLFAGAPALMLRRRR